jgi:RNAse (barnase) inhibitor barstar
MMKRVEIDFVGIKNMEDFHDFFVKRFDFPDFYGKNMAAWIDCVEDYVIEGMTFLEIKNTRDLKENNQEVISAFLECAAFINYRSIGLGNEPLLIISMD